MQAIGGGDPIFNELEDNEGLNSQNNFSILAKSWHA
jgi:hypothetical protein